MKLTILLTLFLVSQSYAGTLRIGVVDSGLDLTDSRLNGHLCATGHKDFTGEGLKDINGHGTEMTGLIEKYAGKGDYCLVIYKYYSDSDPGIVNSKHEAEALDVAVKDGIKIINLSSSGPDFEEKEYLIIRENPDVTFVVAAGNDYKNLDIPGEVAYPASYRLKNETVVGNVDGESNRVPSSNYSKKITVVEMGKDVYTTFINGYGYITGTSASCAVHTGKMIKEMLNAK